MDITQSIKVVLLMNVPSEIGPHLTIDEIESRIMDWKVKSISFDAHTNGLPIVTLGVK